MAKVKLEGLKLRVDDVWEGVQDGSCIYLDLNTMQEAPLSFGETHDQQKATLRGMYAAGEYLDYSGELKNQLIESCLEILKIQEKEGKRPKGRTALIVHDMTGISVSYVKMYLADKNRAESEKETYVQHEAQRKQLNTLCSQIRTLKERIHDFDWDTDQVNTKRAYDELYSLLDELEETLDISERRKSEEENMEKIEMTYELNDEQSSYLDHIHDQHPALDRNVVFEAIMLPGSSIDISERLRKYLSYEDLQKS